MVLEPWLATHRAATATVNSNWVFPGMTKPASPAQLWLYVESADASFKRATSAGCQVVMPPADMFWGDRMSKVTDKWGNDWAIATHVKDLTPQETEKAAQAFIAEISKKK
jgi:uncharacterized glyoxalase superfamily protein PhnB